MYLNLVQIGWKNCSSPLSWRYSPNHLDQSALKFAAYWSKLFGEYLHTRYWRCVHFLRPKCTCSINLLAIGQIDYYFFLLLEGCSLFHSTNNTNDEYYNINCYNVCYNIKCNNNVCYNNVLSLVCYNNIYNNTNVL